QSPRMSAFFLALVQPFSFRSTAIASMIRAKRPDKRYGSPRVGAMRLCPTLYLLDQRNVARILISGMEPTVLVVIGHALIGQRFHLLERTVALRLLQLEHANELVAAGIVHFVKLVAGAEFGADRVP